MRMLSFILLYLTTVDTTQTQFTKADLDFVKLTHRSFCGFNSLCSSANKVLAGTDNRTRTIDDLPFSPPEFIHPDCCNPCSCDITTCVDFGTCCPDILDRLPTVEESQQPRRVMCQYTSLKAVGYTQKFWIYHLCAANYQDNNDISKMNIKSKCENRTSYFDLDVRTPVYDITTDKTFSNRYCAICNFVNESTTVPWKMRLSCYNGAEFRERIDSETLIPDVLETQNCDIEFHWPMDPNSGYVSPTCRTLVSQCNTTGKWVQYDPVIEAACHAYRSFYDFKYNNVFCFMCNEVTSIDQCVDLGGQVIGSISFSAVLDFNRGPDQVIDVLSRCADTQVYDHYMNVCRDLSCNFPRILQAGECVNIGDRLTEVAYRLQLKFQVIGVYGADMIEEIAPLIRDYTMNLTTSWNSLIAAAQSSLFYKFSFRVIDSNTMSETTDPTIPSTLSDKIQATEGTGTTTVSATTDSIDLPKKKRRRRQTDNTTQSPALDQSEEVTFNNPPNVVDLPSANEQIQVLLAVDYILWEIEWYFKLGPHSEDFVDNVLQVDETNITLHNELTGLSFSISLSVVDFRRTGTGIPADPATGESLATFPIFIQLPFAYLLLPVIPRVQTMKQTLICPLIDIDNSEYAITERFTGIYVKELNITFDRTLYERTNSTYSICKDAFLSVTDRFAINQTTVTPPETGVTPQGVLSVVCACISILCALLTLLTYGLFSELRTQPGINNMFLCVYLICAQALFTFASPQHDVVSGNVCSLFGALVHFFWLMVVFSMNVCCYHMVMVFIGQSHNRTKTSRRRVKTALYTVYCVVSSLLFVAINIIVVVVDTDNKETGYGNGICYISRSEMVGYVFALPLGIVLMINLASFVTVIIKISRSPTVKSSTKKDRNYFKIYAKLSSVTGLTWIFGFLFEFTDQTVFEYLFIILNGGIGVLIFLSFVCNKRIYEMYKGKIFKRVYRKDTTYGTSSKTKETQLNGTSSVSRSTTETQQ